VLAAVPSAVITGIEGSQVSVEVHVSNGLPGFTVVGLPDAAVRESRDRVRAALLSSDLAWPLRRVTVNLAPSGMRKGGAGLDLPIAIGLLVAAGELDPRFVSGMAFVGELGLDGSLRGVPGTVALAASLSGFCLVVPEASVGEAHLGGAGETRSAPTLRALVDRLCRRRPWGSPRPARPRGNAASGPTHLDQSRPGDLRDVKGQPLARRALEVAAAGAHHILFIGAPGSGKSMLANRLPGLLPDLDHDTAFEVARIRSVCGVSEPANEPTRRPPFRAPHHGASGVAIIGGGTPWIRPGEISLAHGGVLFLDEFGEFPPAVLETLRQPLEEGVIRVSRARGSVSFPARFILVGAMNPCPCGEGGLPGTCKCSESAKERYARRLSGPLLDRFDIAIRVARPAVEDLLSVSDRQEENTATVAARVALARQFAAQRGSGANSDLQAADLAHVAPMTRAATKLVEKHLRKGRLTARGYDRVRRIARTVADLGGGGACIESEHVSEALLLRSQRNLLLGENP
jgi:magnesium chelatase family protein